MNQDKMYDDLRDLLRGKENECALYALSIILIRAGAEIKPFYAGEKHLYIRCDNIPFSNVRIIEFLSTANFLKLNFVALMRKVDFIKEEIITPYIHIYK